LTAFCGRLPRGKIQGKLILGREQVFRYRPTDLQTYRPNILPSLEVLDDSTRDAGFPVRCVHALRVVGGAPGCAGPAETCAAGPPKACAGSEEVSGEVSQAGGEGRAETARARAGPSRRAAAPGGAAARGRCHPVGCGSWWLAHGACGRAGSRHAGRRKLQGESFYPDRTEFWNRGLVLSEGRGLVPARDVRIQIPLRNGEVPDGKSYDVRPRSGPGSPLIYMSRKPPSARKRLTQVVMKGYSMRLVFGRRQNGRLPGRLYLCLPDGQRSYVAGTFNAAIH
jgi:hypothetical protein